ncbi:MAG TPA: NrfD/PsrC family molybdoenzyme membrane anchor subunit [Chloroflexia bacterium]|nr:NrfD/PsrC family molybdoenzyme membrane anchor subunit [Chloroflexia bacterium]
MGFLLSLLALKSGTPAETIPQTDIESRRNRRGRQNKNEFISYHGRPVLKKAHWVWHIWLYFWIGGIAGGASAIAALASLFGNRDRNYPIIRSARYLSLAALLVSPVLLILDLGRPERFHHMLRIFKFRSPLNVGTYILSATSVLGGFNAARQVVEDGIVPENSLPGKLALTFSNPATQTLQGLFGLGLGSYTGVVLSATATPAWAQASRTMGPIFLCTGFANGAAAISLINALQGEDDPEIQTALERIEQMATLAEMSLTLYTTWKFKPEVRKAFFDSVGGKIAAAGVVQGQLIPLTLAALGLNKSHSRLSRIFNALLVLSGGFMLRMGIIEGGKSTTLSADAYHSITRGEDARPGQPEFDLK